MTDAEKASWSAKLREGQREYERKGNELKDDFNLRQNEEVANCSVRSCPKWKRSPRAATTIDRRDERRALRQGYVRRHHQVLSILQQRAAKSAVRCDTGETRSVSRSVAVELGVAIHLMTAAPHGPQYPGELAVRFGCALQGDSDARVTPCRV